MPTSPDIPSPPEPPSRFADDWDAAVIVRPADQVPVPDVPDDVEGDE